MSMHRRGSASRSEWDWSTTSEADALVEGRRAGAPVCPAWRGRGRRAGRGGGAARAVVSSIWGRQEDKTSAVGLSIEPCGRGIVNIFRTTKDEVYLDTHF
jgi:hypothetical protein